MSTLSELLGGASTPLEKLELALQNEMTGGRNKKHADFKEAYPLIEQHLARKVTQTALLNKFNGAYGHKLYPLQFRKMLEAERTRRHETGDDATCPTCGDKFHSAENAVPDDISSPA